MRRRIQPNWVDRVVNFVNPVAGAHRLRARLAIEASGGFHGADKSRRRTSEWKPALGDIDDVLSWDLDTLRERSHDLFRNSPIATGAINTKVNHVLGAGLRARPQVDFEFLGLSEEEAAEWEEEARREWRFWGESAECDVQRVSTFNELAGMAFRGVLLSGDILASKPFLNRAGSPFGLKVQLIEGERLSNSDWQADDERLVGGVEKDGFGAPIKYHIARAHPGNIRDRKGVGWDIVPVFNSRGERQILHLYNRLLPNQTRGIPDLAPVIETFKQMNRLVDAEIDAAVINSFFTVFIKTETEDGFAPMAPTSETGGKTSDEDYKLGSGAMLDLLPNEDVEFADPKRPNDAVDKFLMAMLKFVGASIGIPVEILIQHFTASYSASRAAVEMAWRFFRQRRTWLADGFYQPFYEALISESVARGRLSAPGFFADDMIRRAYLGCSWTGPSKMLIQEVQEVEAAIKKIDAGLSNKAKETAALTGEDWEEVHKQRVKEANREREDGIVSPQQKEEQQEQLDEDLKKAAIDVLKEEVHVA